MSLYVLFQKISVPAHVRTSEMPGIHQQFAIRELCSANMPVAQQQNTCPHAYVHTSVPMQHGSGKVARASSPGTWLHDVDTSYIFYTNKLQ